MVAVAHGQRGQRGQQMRYSLCNDFLNSKKVVYPLLDRLGPYLSGDCSTPPWAVEIHPTAKCNHRCIHCSYEERNESRVELDAGVMERLVASLIRIKVRGVYFSGGGEPCVYPGLPKYISTLNDNGVEVALVTNGSVVERLGIAEVADKINYIAVSVPSCIPSRFDEIAGNPNLEPILALPEGLHARHGDKAPIVGSRVVVTSLIVDEVPDILQTLKDRGFDYALFKIVRDYEDRGLGLDDVANTRLSETVAELAREGKIDPQFTNLDRLFTYRKPYEPVGDCYVNAMGMLAVVTPEGDVYPNISEIANQNFWVGNLHNEDFDAMWHGEQHGRVKAYSSKLWCEGKCRNCRAISYNNLIAGLVNGMPAELDPFV